MGKFLNATVPNPPTDPRYKLQKGDLAFLVKSLMERGYDVHSRKGDRIEAYDPQTHEFICGLTWRKGTADAPGRWTFDMTMADVFALRDLQSLLAETTRLATLRKHALTAWMEFVATKSGKRWARYLGIVAARITRTIPGGTHVG